MDRRVEAPPRGQHANAPHPTSEQASARLLLASWLRGARQGRGLSLADVTKVTKIQARTLEHLEAGRFDQLPADVFVRGFVRSYARCVGLDPDEAVRRYSECGKLPGPVAATTTAAALLESMAELAPTSVHVIRDAAIDAPIEVIATPSETEIIAAEVIAIAMPAATPTDDVAAIADAPVKKPRKRRAPAVPGAPKKSRSRKRVAVGTEPPPSEGIAAASETVLDASGTGPLVDAVADAVSVSVSLSDAVSVSIATATETATETATATATETAADPVPATATAAVADPVPAPAADPVSTDPAPPAVAPIRIIRVRPPVAAPRLVIDDSDPESAALEQDTRSPDEPHKSFLPKTLLDNLLDGERPRQGGLTLAVIILLIAATLTLSYLMRRPSSSGEGITSLPPPPASIA